MAHPEHTFGDTSPCLAIARKYGVDYGTVLKLTDYCVHGREAPDLWAVVQLHKTTMSNYDDMLEDIKDVARRTRSMHGRTQELHG